MEVGAAVKQSQSVVKGGWIESILGAAKLLGQRLQVISTNLTTVIKLLLK